MALVLIDGPLARPWFDRGTLVDFLDMLRRNYGLVSGHKGLTLVGKFACKELTGVVTDVLHPLVVLAILQLDFN